MTVVQFPTNDKPHRDQVTDLKERLVEEGIFDQVEDIPTHLVLFILQHWQEIYDEGFCEGLLRDYTEFLH